MKDAATSIGGLAFRYLTRRARWYLTGIGSVEELKMVLRLAPAHGLPFRPRGRGRGGWGGRRPRASR